MLLHRISTKSVKCFMGHMRKHICGLCELSFIMVQYGLTIRTHKQVSIKVSDIKYEKEICPRIFALVLDHQETDRQANRRTDKIFTKGVPFFSRESEREKIKWGGSGRH
jgi:hypothetical protein